MAARKGRAAGRTSLSLRISHHGRPSSGVGAAWTRLSSRASKRARLILSCADELFMAGGRAGNRGRGRAAGASPPDGPAAERQPRRGSSGGARDENFDPSGLPRHPRRPLLVSLPQAPSSLRGPPLAAAPLASAVRWRSERRSGGRYRGRPSVWPRLDCSPESHHRRLRPSPPDRQPPGHRSSPSARRSLPSRRLTQLLA